MPRPHPALELLALYARRWEQELAYRELKVNLRASGDSPLASHTPDTAAQEIVALLVAMAMVARARLQIAEAAGAAAWRVSFGRTLAALQPLWMLLSVGGDLLSASQRRAFVARVLRPLTGQLLPPKRRARGLSENGAPTDQGLAENNQHSRAQRQLAVRVIYSRRMNPFTALRLEPVMNLKLVF